jgi:catabolite regulation protein CreA
MDDPRKMTEIGERMFKITGSLAWKECRIELKTYNRSHKTEFLNKRIKRKKKQG